MSALTIKQENFCQVYVETGNASEAYRQAYDVENMKPETINRKAKELMDNGKITARTEELKAHHMKRHEVTVDSLTGEYEESRTLARKIKNPAAMNGAIAGKAKLHGLGLEARTPVIINFQGMMEQLYGDKPPE